MKLPVLSKKHLTILAHIAAWLLLFNLPALLRPAHEEAANLDNVRERGLAAHYITTFFIWIFLFYFNAYFLLPRLIDRRRYLAYGVSLLPVLSMLFLVNWISFKVLVHEPYSWRGGIAFFVLPCIFFLSCSTAITMFQNKFRSDRLLQLRETENLKTELAFLRSQVSPHFMFNVLNNMVMLARKGSESLEPSLFKLSTLMRYMLYETDDKKVLLEREVEYLQSYIDLQLQRFGKKVAVDVHIGSFDEGYFIEPMLLIPFVENAFKHGTGFRQKGEISISLEATGGVLQFRVSNYYEPGHDQVRDHTSGIGLQNVKRRLDLLYGADHELTIDKGGTRFCVILILHLQHAEMYRHR